MVVLPLLVVGNGVWVEIGLVMVSSCWFSDLWQAELSFNRYNSKEKESGTSAVYFFIFFAVWSSVLIAWQRIISTTQAILHKYLKKR